MERVFCLFLFISSAALTGGCIDKANARKYTISAYFTSLDSTRTRIGQRFRYRYEIYNADSNMIYQEKYRNPDDPEMDWGKLSERSTVFYDGATIKKKIRAYGLDLPERERGTVVYKYEKGVAAYENEPEEHEKWRDRLEGKRIYGNKNLLKRIEFRDPRKLMFVIDYQYTQ